MSVDYQIESTETLADTSRCRLFLELAPEYVMFAILNSDSRTFIGLQYINLDKLNTFQHLKDILSSNKWLAAHYLQTRIYYNFPETQLVPAQLYKPVLLEHYLNISFGDILNGELCIDEVPGWGVVNAYRVPVSLHQTVQSHFPHPDIQHTHTGFLQKLNRVGVPSDGDIAFVVFYERKLLLALFKNGSLHLLKNYEYETAEDVTYHLLHSFSQLKLNCETTRIIVSGLVDTQSSVYTDLQKYFLKLEFEQRPEEFSYSSSFDDYPPHFFTSLLGVALCE